MKKTLLVTLLLFYGLACSQTWKVQYNYKVINTISKSAYTFPAILSLDSSGQVLYTVKYGINNQLKENNQDNGIFTLADKSSWDYVMYSNKDNPALISDEINGKKYLFIDEVPSFSYTITEETKTEKKIELTKATATFRGRNYTIWFDANSNIKGAPWKFSGLPGLAYEIYDDQNLFLWKLQSIERSEKIMMDPFKEKKTQDFVSYNQYPKLNIPPKFLFAILNIQTERIRIMSRKDKG